MPRSIRRTSTFRRSAELDLNIYTTELFKLPAGGVGLAFGGQFRRETIEQDPDQINIDGDTIGSSPTAITHAGRKDFAFYGEVRVPMFSPEMGIMGLHSVEATGAFRYEEFRNNGTNVLVPKVGVRWQPFDEQLTIRSTWGEGFREPSLFELYSSPTTGLLPTTTPQSDAAGNCRHRAGNDNGRFQQPEPPAGRFPRMDRWCGLDSEMLA